MKCPECGQWNRASMPHCTNCGTPLNIDEASRLLWKDTLKDSAPSTAYLRADEFGQIDASPDARDELAGEMQELKRRKREGEERKTRLTGRKPSFDEEEVVITEERAAGSRRSGRRDIPNTAIRVQPPSRNDQTRREQSEIRHRVRFMNENGAFAESRTYDPVPPADSYTQGTGSWHLAGPLYKGVSSHRDRRHGFIRVLLIVVIIAALVGAGYLGYEYFTREREPAVNRNAIVTASVKDDLPAHTVLIPGENGSNIYIRELHASYKVIDGFATVEVADHTWYDNLEGALDETMEVTMTPFLKTASGKQTPLDLITYEITIPLSKISLISPDSLRTTVSTTMAAIKIEVRAGSRVTVNGTDCSDTVNSETGEMSYNATVQPIGDNVFNFVVRSQYCRENSISVILYREPQEIPLDLSVGTYGATDQKIMKVTATTLPGAYVEVASPHSDLNITDLDSTGKFSFNAIFDKIGTNTIVIRSSVPGKRTSEVKHEVYYLPPASEYTKKAWPLSADGYSELLSNMQVRTANSQVYVVKGIVQYSVSEKPERVVINSSEDGKSQPVLVENYTKTPLVPGTYYRIYADAYSTYNSMPWLNARYVYKK